MTQTVITGTGRFVPPRVVTNADLTQRMDTTDEWIEQRTGIHKRHWVPEEGGVGASDLGCEASKIALQRAGWSAMDIDLIIFATLSPDIFFPGSGCLLQHKLGLEQTPAIDIRQQCTGFLYGLEMAHAYIYSGMAQRILLVGAEVHSTGLDLSTNGRDVAVIFGDGAGATCVEGQAIDDNVGVLATAMHAQGAFAESLMLEAPASKCNPRLDQEMLAQGRQYPHMDGRMIFKMAVGRLPLVAREALEKAHLTQDDIDLFIPHQANFRINKAFQKAMDLPDHKVYHNIQHYGNTTAASIPMAFDEALEQQVINPGDTVMFLGLGAGLTWGSVIYRLPKR